MGRIDVKETGWDDVDWIHLAYNRDQRPALLKMIMKFGFHKFAGNFLAN
jgi:hypothetical protein